MNTHLEATTDVYMVQPPEILQSPIETFDANAAIVDALPFWRLDGTGGSLLVAGIWIDNWLRSVLPFDVVPKGVAGVSGVADYIVGMEFAGDEPSLAQQGRGPCDISHLKQVDIILT